MRNIKDAYVKQHKKYEPDNEFQLKKAVEEACAGVLPSFTVADQGKVLAVADDGTKEWSSALISLKSDFDLLKELVTANVTYNSNGGSSVTAESVVFGHTATEPEDPTKESKVFAGWFTEAELTNEYDFTSPVKSSFTLYAKWDDEEEGE